MKRNWTEEELVERWTLFPDELALVGAKTGHTRLGFAVMLRFFAGEGRFPRDKHEVPVEVLRFVGEQVGELAEGWLRYDWSGRSVKYHRAQIREFFGFREATVRDGEDVASWLLEEVLPREQDTEKLRAVFYERCRALKIEPPTPGRVERLVVSAARRFEERFCSSVFGRLPEDALLKMDALHAAETERKGATYLFESSWKEKYTDRGVRKILARYAQKASLERSISPHKMRHFLFTWLKKQGVDDALIQPYSGHQSRKSLEIYSLLAIGEAQESYDEVMDRVPV